LSLPGQVEEYIATCSSARQFQAIGSGDALHGREDMTGAAGHGFALRWHLHPNVQASLGQGGQTALVRSGSGAGWRLRVEGVPLTLESSIYCGSGAPRRSLQIKAAGTTQGDATVVSWSFTREKI